MARDTLLGRLRRLATVGQLPRHLEVSRGPVAQDAIDAVGHSSPPSIALSAALALALTTHLIAEVDAVPGAIMILP